MCSFLTPDVVTAPAVQALRATWAAYGRHYPIQEKPPAAPGLMPVVKGEMPPIVG